MFSRTTQVWDVGQHSNQITTRKKMKPDYSASTKNTENRKQNSTSAGG